MWILTAHLWNIIYFISIKEAVTHFEEFCDMSRKNLAHSIDFHWPYTGHSSLKINGFIYSKPSNSFCWILANVFGVSGVKMTGSWVNISSMLFRSRSLTTGGRYGGTISLCSSKLQSMGLKNKCCLISFRPSEEANLSCGFFCKKPFRMEAARTDRLRGILIGFSRMTWNKWSSVFRSGLSPGLSLRGSKGERPAIISYMRTPRAHQSTLKS